MRKSAFRSRARATGGFTLPEMMIAAVIGSIALSIATGAVMALAKGSQSLINYSEMNTESRQTLQELGRQLRSASNVLEANSSRLRIETIESDGTIRELLYDYDSGDETLTLTDITADTSKVILHDVNSLDFDYFTLRHAATTTPLEIKHVQLEAELKRNVLKLTNRNHIISARFMLRNKRVSN
jgi:prepilin-type N-terminal cleavage/methylation domain-containing protein